MNDRPKNRMQKKKGPETKNRNSQGSYYETAMTTLNLAGHGLSNAELIERLLWQRNQADLRLDVVEVLLLQGNRLTTIPDEVFSLFPSVKRLHLSNNALTNVPARIGTLSHLEKLDLHNNPRLTALPASMGSMQRMRVLYSGHTGLPQKFQCYTNSREETRVVLERVGEYFGMQERGRHRCSNAVVAVLGSRYLGSPQTRYVGKDMTRMIAKMVWMTRNDFEKWSGCDDDDGEILFRK